MMMSPSNYVPLILVVLELVVPQISGGLLGAGEGEGSCAAPPFRAHYVKWTHGCPGFAPCCSEYGYCRPLEEWELGLYRDCNGVSNGTPLPPETLEAEALAGPYQGTPAGDVGPPPDVLRSHHGGPPLPLPVPVHPVPVAPAPLIKPRLPPPPPPPPRLSLRPTPSPLAHLHHAVHHPAPVLPPPPPPVTPKPHFSSQLLSPDKYVMKFSHLPPQPPPPAAVRHPISHNNPHVKPPTALAPLRLPPTPVAPIPHPTPITPFHNPALVTPILHPVTPLVKHPVQPPFHRPAPLPTHPPLAPLPSHPPLVPLPTHPPIAPVPPPLQAALPVQPPLPAGPPLHLPVPSSQQLKLPASSGKTSTSQCQPLVGGGSYTCISFGAPSRPIYAFHTRFDKNGFFMGGSSGFNSGVFY